MRRILSVERTVPLPLASVRGALADGPGVSVVSLVVETGVGSVGERVALEFAPPAVGPTSVCWPLRWTPEGHRRLLPAFQGSLLAEEAGWETRLRLTGAYRPPLGLFGAVFDAVVGRRIARRSVERLVDRLVHRVLGAAAHASASAWHPAPAAPDLHPRRTGTSA